MDYPSSNFAKLKYTDTLTPTNSEGQSYLNSCTDLTSTWLHPKIFRHWIINSDNPVPKYSKLLASTVVVSDQRDTYTHTLHKLLLTAECSVYGHVRCECTLTFHLYAITVSPHSLVKRTTNSYSTQWPTLDIAIILVIAYHLVANILRT